MTMEWKVPVMPQHVIDFGRGYRDGYNGVHIKNVVPSVKFGQDYQNGHNAGVKDIKENKQFQPELWLQFTDDGEGHEWDNRKIKT